MSGTYQLHSGEATLSDLADGFYSPKLPIGAGNVYYVMDSSNTLYSKFVDQMGGPYENDGTEKVYSTIQAAVDACTTTAMIMWL